MSELPLETANQAICRASNRNQRHQHTMMVMCANNSQRDLIAYIRQHPRHLGWIIGVSHYKAPRIGVPFALDNDAFGAWKNRVPWDEAAWLKMLGKVKKTGLEPLWALVPDVVADRAATIANWERYAPIVAEFGFKRAFAVQDGMVMSDVPDCDVVFVGGTTEWKWKTAHVWCKHFPRVHIGRVRIGRLEYCERIGAESVDGTGFMRETWHGKPARQLRDFVEGFRKHQQFIELAL